MTNTQRDIVIDLSRFIAAFAVIYIHSSALWTYDKYSWVQIINSISRFALPMFFFLSGYSLTFSDMSKQRTYSLKSFLKHRSKKILVPFIIWSTVYEFELYLIYNYFKVSAQNEFANFDFKSVLITIVTGNSKYHLYFIVVLIQLYIIYWILFNMKIYSKVSFVAISFGITIIATLLSYTTQNDGLIVHYSFLPWLFYFAFGMWLASNKHNGKKYFKNGLNNLGHSFLIIGVGLVIIETYYGKFGIHNSRISVLVYSLGYIISSHNFLNYINSLYIDLSTKTQSLVAFLGTKSFGVYLLHPLVLDLLWFIEKIMNININHSSIVCVLSIAFLTMISCYLIIEFATRYIPKSKTFW